MENAITIDGLTKYYDGRKILDDVTLAIPKGCIYGLLGRNGIGKTTLIRILLGLEPPTRGSTKLFGCDSMDMPAAVRGRMGYVAEGHHLIERYRVGRLVDLCRALALQWDEKLFDDLMIQFRLPLDRKIKQMSMGMRAQLSLILAMATDPELLIMDDPTLGLDTTTRRQFLEMAIDLIQRDGERTILFSSHILGDVERIADRIGIIIHGRLVVDCSLEELKTRVRKMRVIFDDAVPEELYIAGVISRKDSGREMIITVADWNEQKQAYLETCKPKECVDIPLNLEDMFVEITA